MIRYFFISLVFSYTALNSVCAQSPQTPQSTGVHPVTDKVSKLATKAQSGRAITSIFNEYKNVERNKGIDPDQKNKMLDALFHEASASPASWQFQLLKFIRSDKTDSEALTNALTKGDKKIVLPYAIQFEIKSGKRFNIKQYTAELEAINPIDPASFEYHYNTLMSASENAFIYAKGLTDLVPLSILQEQHQVRKDVTLRFYDGSFSEPNSYLCISSGSEILAKYPDAFYTGLLIKVNGDKSIDELKRNVNLFHKNYLTADSWTQEQIGMYGNYLPAYVLLYKYYRSVDTTLADDYLRMINRIAERTSQKEKVKQLLN